MAQAKFRSQIETIAFQLPHYTIAEPLPVIKKSLMKILALLTLTLIISIKNLSGQDSKFVKAHLDSAKSIIANLPKSFSANHESKYELDYNKKFNQITITDFHFKKNSNEKTVDYNTYTFDLSDIDPNFIIIKQNEKNKHLYIQLFSIDNEPKIKQEVYVKGVKRLSSIQDRVTLGTFYDNSFPQIENLKSHIAIAIKELLGDKALKKYSTNSENMEVMTVNNKSGHTSTINIPNPSENEEPKYVFGTFETSPTFDGATTREEIDAKLKIFFDKKIKIDSPKNNGTVYVSFIIDKGGNTTNIKILRGADKALNDLAIKYCNDLKWTPGIIEGQKVLTTYMTAIKFKK